MNIFLLTKNKFKAEEIKNIISGYGITLNVLNKYNNIENIDILKSLNLTECILIREKTALINKNTKKKSKLKHLESVEHSSKLNVIFYNNGVLKEKIYNSKIEGFIDLNKKINNKEFYNWDDIFISIKTMKSYYEMKNISGKFSARSVVISDFLNDIVNFKEKKDLNFNPLNQKNVIDFSGNIYNLIENNIYIKKHLNSNILKPLINKVKNNGLFTRSPLNKKQRNYWYPALNAGLPLVSKQDEIHEITFMFHDLMHHLIPDLIHTGNSSKNHKEAYVIHRMLSEAFTIVLADMIYISELEKSGVKYDFEKRKIYPVYKSIGIKELTMKELKSLIWANVNFALLGNESLLRNKASTKSVDDYVNKFKNFFIEDYRWTINNFNNMDSNKETMKKWYDFNKFNIKKENTIDFYAEFIKGNLNYENKVAIIFEKVWKTLESFVTNNEKFDKEKSISDAFKRYMVGQSILFIKYDFEISSHIFNKLINEELNKNVLNKNDILRIKTFFNIYIEKLISKNIISTNEGDLYKEIVPLFEAYYVFYDSKPEYTEIKQIIDKEF
jgi:hypothetical protein